MTTDIKIRVNGNYTAEGVLTIKRGNDIADEAINILVTGAGSSEAVEKSFNIPHGSTVEVAITEREANEDELHAGANGDTGNTGEELGDEADDEGDDQREEPNDD